MVQTTKGGVAPEPEKPTKAAQANDKAAMDKMAESPGRSEPSDTKDRNEPSKAKAKKDEAEVPTTNDWAEDHPAGPAAPSEAYNSGS